MKEAKTKKAAEKKIVKKTTATKEKKVSLSVDVLDTKGKKKSVATLPKELFSVSVSDKLIAQAIRVHQANKRQGGAVTQTRGEVTGSGRKVWRQKGTGRARHGHRYAPIFVGGGVAHGPRPRDFSMTMNKKMRRKALAGALTKALAAEKVVIVDNLDKLTGKTKELSIVLSNISCKVDGVKLLERVLIATAGTSKDVYMAGRNIPKLTVQQSELLTVYDVVNTRKLVIARDALDKMVETFVTKTKKSK